MCATNLVTLAGTAPKVTPALPLPAWPPLATTAQRRDTWRGTAPSRTDFAMSATKRATSADSAPRARVTLGEGLRLVPQLLFLLVQVQQDTKI